MQTLASPNRHPRHRGLVAAAEPPVRTAAAAATARNSPSDVIPDRPGNDDAFALYEVKLGGDPLNSAEQIARWQDEFKAGRARAGDLVGSHLSYLALTPGDCAVAREALFRSDELGNDQASWQLAQLAENTSCGEIDDDARERWLKKAVTLDYLVGGPTLHRVLFADGPEQRSLAAVSLRACGRGLLGSGVSQRAKIGGRAGFDTAALQEMEKTLPSAERKRAETEAAQILAQMLKRHERFAPARPQEFARGGQGAKASKGWGFAAHTLDYSP